MAHIRPLPVALTYDDLIESARDLLCESIRDPENEGHPEYRRGIINLIAEVSGRFEMDTGDRMNEVAAELGLPEVY